MGIRVAKRQLLVAKIKKEHKMTTQNKKGFTIIEVVLVLAIAGLIFLMVFIALPALQRSQRNTQRSDDMSRILTAANSYQSNNNGKTPFVNNDGTYSIAGTFIRRYIDETCPETEENPAAPTCDGSEFKDPDGNNYKMSYDGSMNEEGVTGTVSQTWDENDHTIHVFTYASCGDEGSVVKGTGERQYAILYVQEGGAVTCNDNH